MRAKLVTKIEANPLLSKENNENRLLRVAAYCRVSTDSEDQLDSYRAQVAHYTDVIAKNPRWRFVDIYADEGITGTLAKKRKNFIRMIKDCDKGKIDLILTKSIARFARNTVDSLNYVRRLKAQGVGVFFEEQNIDSLKSDSEMMIGFHSVLAQAESENISANVRWGIRERMKTGTFAFRYNILGYKKGVDGEPEIVPEEAEIIKKIYTKYLEGDSLFQLKTFLEENKIKTKQGKSKWELHAIQNILENERYTGDMLCQKTFTENCITKKVIRNRGEMTKYLIINNHPAIIEKEIFRRAQMEIARRGNKRKISDKTTTGRGKYSGKYALSNLLICGECGSPYRRITWVKNGKKKVVWRCLSRIEHGTKLCKNSPSIDEEKLLSALQRTIKKVVGQEDGVNLIFSCVAYAATGNNDVLDVYALEQEIKSLTQISADYIGILAKTNGDKQRVLTEIETVNRKITALREQLKQTRDIMAANEKVALELDQIRKSFECFDDEFKGPDDVMIRRIVEYIRVVGDGKISITFKGGGLQIEESL